MTTAVMTKQAPIEGPAYDPSRPETRQPWLDFRREGITATQIRDWGMPARRRKIIEEKCTGAFEDLSYISYVAHGTLREPVIAEWVQAHYGIHPCDSVYAAAEESRHLASPDGVSLDIFTKDLIVGSEWAILSEIKTSKHDLMPGRLSNDRRLIKIDPASNFARSNYYTQMQWQMYVMNADKTLFVWEQHDNVIDAETGTFSPVGPPQIAWIPRDQGLINVLVNEIAPKALGEIDAARAAVAVGGLPPVADIPSEQAMLVAELVKARQAEALAISAKQKAWAALQRYYLEENVEDLDKVDAGVAWLTVSTSSRVKNVTDMEAARKRAPKLTAQYEALIKRHTKPQTITSRSLTVTEKKEG